MDVNKNLAIPHTLLPCANGVVDLETGNLVQDDLGNCNRLKLSYLGLDIDAPRWKTMLLNTFCQREELLDYFEYIVGQAATGFRTQDIFCITGNSVGGKTFITETLRSILNDFAASIHPEIFKTKRDLCNIVMPQPELYHLNGRRLLVSQVDGIKSMNPVNLKTLTCDQTLTARGVYHREPTTFEQTHTLLLYAGELPNLNPLSGGVISRLKIIPLDAEFVWESNSDKIDAASHIYPAMERHDFEQTVYKEESSGIMAWLVRCAKKFLSSGAKMPAAPGCVMEAVDNYRQRQNKRGRRQ